MELTLGAFHHVHHVFEHAYEHEEGDKRDKLLAGFGALKRDINDNLEGAEDLKEALLQTLESLEHDYGEGTEEERNDGVNWWVDYAPVVHDVIDHAWAGDDWEEKFYKVVKFLVNLLAPEFEKFIKEGDIC